MYPYYGKARRQAARGTSASQCQASRYVDFRIIKTVLSAVNVSLLKPFRSRVLRDAYFGRSGVGQENVKCMEDYPEVAREQPKGFRPGFEPSSRWLEPRPTSRCAVSWTCLTLLAPPDSAGGDLGCTRFVSRQPLPNHVFGQLSVPKCHVRSRTYKRKSLSPRATLSFVFSLIFFVFASLRVRALVCTRYPILFHCFWFSSFSFSLFVICLLAQSEHAIMFLCILCWIQLAVCRAAGAAAAAVSVEFIRI